jgi:hypothetical protein
VANTNNNAMKLNFLVGYVTDWSSENGGNSIALNIEGNDKGIQFLIHRLQAVLDGTQEEDVRVQLSSDDEPGLYLEPRSMRVNMLKLAE